MGAEDWATSSASCRAKAAESARIKADIDAFLKSGGKPTHCEFGETAEHGKPYNPSNIVDPKATAQRAAKKANEVNHANAAAKSRVKLTQKHRSLMQAMYDLKKRGDKSNKVAIQRETGQNIKTLDYSIDTLIIRGMVEQLERKQFGITKKGAEYIGVSYDQ